MSIFEEARAAASASLIEHLFGSPDAYWDGDEFWTRNPARADNRIGSFHINKSGQWYDHATGEGGDHIKLVELRDNCSPKEAAETVVRAAGGVVDSGEPPAKKKKKKEKPAPVFPVPETAGSELNSLVKWFAEKRDAKPTKGWKYRDTEGRWIFSVVRYDREDGSKDVLPFYYAGHKWHMGQAMESGRPLYHAEQLGERPEDSVLVVEGEKCADVEVPGYIVVTWAGGSGAVSATDWSPLNDRDVVIWPDADEPGKKAARAVYQRLPGSTVLAVWDTDKPDGWDLADAVADGIDPLEFIRECPRVHADEPPAPPPEEPDSDDTRSEGGGPPFVCLGFSESAHHFLLAGQDVPYQILRGSFSSSKLLELAPLSWWYMQDLVSDQGNIKVTSAQDMVRGMSHEAGRYFPEKIRGIGVWRDHTGIIVNDGEKIVTREGGKLSYSTYGGQFYYVSSQHRFGPVSGTISTETEGQKLLQLFEAQAFQRRSMAVAALGWSLLAPFGGILAWRPHIWVTGRKGTGKSYILETLIEPLCGPSAYKGSGKDTEPGIRRSLRNDSRPVVLDEMESQSQREAAKVQDILELARNASSNQSSQITKAKSDGGVDEFKIRSCFCFASVQIPHVSAAVESRITRCEIRWMDNYEEQEKIQRTKGLVGEVMTDPGKFRRRIFRYLPEILEDVEWLREYLLGKIGDQRQVDQFAPMLAAVWWVMHDNRMYEQEAVDWVSRVVADMQMINSESMDDEDAVMVHILGARIRMDDNKVRAVSELLFLRENAEENEVDTDYAESHLARSGIRVIHLDGERYLAIATKSDEIQRWLRGTPYESGYDAQVRRHRLCANPQESRQVVFSNARLRARLLKWSDFRELYMEGSS